MIGKKIISFALIASGVLLSVSDCNKRFCSFRIAKLVKMVFHIMEGYSKSLHMQLPYRKPGKYSQVAPDYLLTPAKARELEKKLESLKKRRPEAAAEVARLAELGDFSENVEYQLAKGRLRGMNQRILELEHQLNRAVLIEPPSSSRITIGHTVTITNGISESTYQILGSSETNPSKGVISHTSPLGVALLGKKVGEAVTVAAGKKSVEYRILRIV